MAVLAGGTRRPCTPVVLFSHGGPGGAVLDVGGRVRVETCRLEGPRSWRKPRGESAGTRNDWGPSHKPLLDQVGNQQDTRTNAKSARECRDSGVVPEETTRSGEGQTS
jgi:hypothetical protein